MDGDEANVSLSTLIQTHGLYDCALEADAFSRAATSIRNLSEMETRLHLVTHFPIFCPLNAMVVGVAVVVESDCCLYWSNSTVVWNAHLPMQEPRWNTNLTHISVMR